MGGQVLTKSVVAVLLLCAVAVIIATFVALGRPDDVGYPDSATLLIVREFVRTGHMYLGVHSPPYLVTLYGPLTYVFLSLPYRVADAIGASPMVAIRLTVVGGVLLCLAMVYGLSRRLQGSSPVAWLCVLFALSTPALAAWTTQVRPDFLGLGCVLLCLHLFLRTDERRLPWAALVLASLALLFKQTFVAAPAAIFLYLLYRRRWRAAGFWSVGLATVVAGGYLLTLWREPMMLEHLAVLRKPIFEFPGALVIALGAIAVPVAPFALVGGGAGFRSGGEAGRLMVLYCVLAWLLALATVLQVGGNINYFWEPLIASAVLAGPGLRVAQRGLSRVQALAGGLALALLLALTLTQNLAVLQGAYLLWQDRGRSRANWEMLASIVSGRRLLSTLPAVTLLSAAPEIPDPFKISELERLGLWSSAPVVADLEAHRYDLVVEFGQYEEIFDGPGSGDWYRGVDLWSDPIRTALLAAYQPVCQFEGLHVWLPRHRPRDPELLRLCVPL